LIPDEEIAKLKASKVNEPVQEEESGDTMMEQGTQVHQQHARISYICFLLFLSITHREIFYYKSTFPKL
jgi:hypothetical protein